MRTGKLYKHILGNSELPENLKYVFEAWLESAAENIPLPEDYGIHECSEYGHDVNAWFERWFGSQFIEKSEKE